MTPIAILLIGLLGLLVGSVAWTLALAVATERSPLAGPPCTSLGCGGRLPPAGWLPLLGFGVARRCPRCGAAQSPRRLLFELGVAGYFALAAAWLGPEPRRLVATLVFAGPLLVILLVDAWTRLIHTNLVALGLLAGLAAAALDGPLALLGAILAALAAAALFGLFFVLARVIYPTAKAVPFGLGDVYLAAMIGAMVRLESLLPTLFAGVLLAGVAGLALLLTRRVGHRQAIAYGPYLCAGALITLL